jgi:hypothetical protein
VLDYLDDLESDFSRFHRVDDMYALPAPRFFRLAERLIYFDGVITARARYEAAQQEQEQPARAADTQTIGSSRSEIAAHFGDFVSFG